MNEWLAYALSTLALTTPAAAGPTDISTAEDARPAPISQSQALQDTSETVTPLAVGPTGQVLREVGREDTRRNGRTELRPGRLGVLDPSSGDVQQVRGAEESRRGTQTVFGDLNAEYVVWTEQTSTKIAESDWTMYAFDRDTEDTTVLARAEPVDDAGTVPTVPGYTIPRLDGDTVYWSQADRNPDEEGQPSANVYAADADGSGQPERVASDAIMPVATDGWLYYVGFDGSDQPGEARAGQAAPGSAGPPRGAQGDEALASTIHRTSLETGETSTLDRQTDGSVTGLAADGATVAATVGGRHVEVFRHGEHSSTIAGDREHLGWVSVADGVVGFSDGSKRTGQNYLFDAEDRQLYELGAAAPGLARVFVGGSDGGGPAVAWALGEQRQEWRYARPELGSETPEPGHDRADGQPHGGQRD